MRLCRISWQTPSRATPSSSSPVNAQPATCALASRLSKVLPASPPGRPFRILTFPSWLGSLYSSLITDGVEQRLLLNPAQEHALWREAIAANPTADGLGSLDSIATLAAQAFALAADYEAPSDFRRLATTHDARTFAAWAAAFRTLCAKHQCLSPADLPTTLRSHIERGKLSLPPELILFGFDHTLPPTHLHLLEALTEAGCPIRSRLLAHGWESTDESAPATQLTIHCDNPQHEALIAAHWLRNFITTQAADGRTPHVALIVPQLDQTRPTLEATLREVLAPELQHITADLSAGPIAFSTGPSLAEIPVTAAALDLAHWLAGPLEQPRVTSLVLSPFLGHADDLPSRARFDAFRLRQSPRLRPELTMEQAEKQSSRAVWATFLAAAAKRSIQLNTRAQKLSYSDWTEFIRTTLREANWPGDRPLTAQDFAATRAWDHALDAVATLDFTGARIPFATALQALDRQVRSANITPTQGNAVVQVMRPHEAAGTPFDAIVFLRATDAFLPTPERTDPFLPWTLQRDLDMPGTGPELTTTRATDAIASLVASTPNALFLYPAEDDTGPQRLSPIVSALGWSEVSAHDLLPNLAPSPTVLTEAFSDAAGLPQLPSINVFGGARVLKLQAACGFLAFSELRLRATPLDSSAPGFDALESGNFLHRAMQAVWAELKSQQALREKTPEEREALLRRAIFASVDSRIQPESDWDAAYLELQKDRLLQVLRRWLDLELERGPFTILDLEKKEEVTVGPLKLSVRMDRIDKVDGGHVFVDYKTSYASHPKHWEGERPEDPQLPLYSLFSEPGELKGITFAKVRAGKDMSWQGLQAEPGILPARKPVTTDLDFAIEEWRNTLAVIAEDFAAGRATVNPRDFAVDCARCAQRLLCRVNPELLFSDTDQDEDAENAGEAE